MIAIPNAEDVEHYSRRPEAPGRGIPVIADEEPVCLVRVLGTGSGAYWSRGDVDVHVLDAKQRGLSVGRLDRLSDGLVESLVPQQSLTAALRERRERRRLLRSGGVQTTATGLVVLHAPSGLLIPTDRRSAIRALPALLAGQVVSGKSARLPGAH